MAKIHDEAQRDTEINKELKELKEQEKKHKKAIKLQRRQERLKQQLSAKTKRKQRIDKNRKAKVNINRLIPVSSVPHFGASQATGDAINQSSLMLSSDNRGHENCDSF